jgi:hypothetical protein
VIGAGLAVLPFACSATDPVETAAATTTTASQGGGGTAGGGGDGGFFSTSTGMGGGPCDPECAPDLQSIVDCHGEIEACVGTEGCDQETVTCVNACEAAESAKRSVGCDYYATFMDAVDADACFAAVVANIWNAPAHITVERNGTPLPVESFAYTTIGQGPGLAYLPFDNSAGLEPGEVAILFLAGLDGVPGVGNPVCPFPSAVPTGSMLHDQSGKGWSFHVTTDVPVVMYQINPYGGGSAAETGASLLLPTSAWGTNYVAVNGYQGGTPSMNVIAKEDGTTVEMLPSANIAGGGGLPPGSANGLYTFTLDAGQYVQLSQSAPLTGSVLQSDKPIGLMGGTRCSFIPLGVSACDHLEQMIPPVNALGSEYVGVSHTPRTPGNAARWRLIGAVDGTQLTWSSDVGGPAALESGQTAELSTQFAFTVRSQDADHPFVLMALMTGGDDGGLMGRGDPDTVLAVPPDQFLSSYVFFADPTYPITNIVVVRAKNEDGDFSAVTLDCHGTLSGWQSLGGDYEYTRLFLSNGDFELQGNCGAGAHEIFSQGRFGLWVWGWGAPGTSSFTQYVSYGYPGGMNADAINDVVIPPTPK